MTTSKVLNGVLLALTLVLLGSQSGPQSSGRSAEKQPATAWFTDIAKRSNFAYWTNNDLSVRKYFPQPMCGGVAIFDYDNDGKMDIFFTNGAKLPELKNPTSLTTIACCATKEMAPLRTSRPKQASAA